MSLPKWGLAATIKADTVEILNFAAHHLELGAHRLYLYLDEENPTAFAALKAHPKIRVINCDAAHWAKLIGKRPRKHQVRQSLNATHAYQRRIEVDWLIHIDVDEFLWPQRAMAEHLNDLAPETLCARVSPIESVAGDGTVFKGYIESGATRAATVERIYPEFGRYVKGGFLSHVAGKLFIRTGLKNIKIRIHNMFCADEMNPREERFSDVELCHCHATSWEDWLSRYHYRLEKGSYRPELAPVRPHEQGGLSMHDMFSLIEEEEGEAGLRRFFDEVCADSPDLRARLDAEGLLRICDLDLEHKRRKHFG